MKTKNNPHFTVNLKLFLVLPVIFITLVALSSCAAKKKVTTVKTEISPPLPPPPPPPPPPVQNSALNNNVKVSREVVTNGSDQEPFVVVEEMPQFSGGETELQKYIAENMKYPETAKKNKIQGKVIIRFCVTSKGNVDLVTVLKGVDPELDAEAMRVVSTLPVFKPGRQGGKDVPVWYMIPISFSLDGNSRLQQSRYEVVGTDTIYSDTGVMPEFPGGNDALKKFKIENVKYPSKAKSLGIEGTILVNFYVEKDGSLTNIRIMRGISPSLDSEVLRVTKLMPPWQPGKEKGKPVKCMSMTTYDFGLKTGAPWYVPEGEEDIFVVVEEMPYYTGGDSALLAYIALNTKYPESAKTKNIEGRAILRFCVTKDGVVDRVSILRSVSPEIDAEAIKVVKSLPSFRPGKQNGNPVSVWYMVPVTFALTKSTTDSEAVHPKQNYFGYDDVPLFPGRETAMYKFINSNIVYPKTAKERNISGKVVLNYCINSSGLIEVVTVYKGADPELDAEAVRVLKLLPAWQPAKLLGKPVHVWYQVPITFTLN